MRKQEGKLGWIYLIGQIWYPWLMNIQTILNLHTAKRLLTVATVMVLAACASHSSSNRAVSDGYYQVRKGDTLYRIAQRYGQSVQTLVAWNRLPNASKIEVGQVLRVKRKVAAADATETVVQPLNGLQLQWPVDNGNSHIIQSYNGSSSKGIDISGYRGQDVKAAAAGTVLYVGEGVRGYGKLILISHNASTITAYAHNDSILVQKNQDVRKGQTIATMGSSDADRVKLHFEVRIHGKAVNPVSYLP